MFLLDTNVVSEIRRPKPHGAVVAWLTNVPGPDLLVSAVTLSELQAGAEITKRQDPQRGSELERWIDQVPARFTVVPMDGEIFRQWARLMHRRSDALAMDAMIAATAMVHGLTVATRNTRDFVQLGLVALINPFSAADRG